MAKRKKLNTNREYYRKDRCDEIDVFDVATKKDVQKVIQDLKDTLISNKSIVALAAPQIASRYRIFCMKFAGNDIRTFVNPLIIERKGVQLAQEQQIGFDELDNDTYLTFRSAEILAGYQTPTGRVETNKFTGNACVVFEQMIQLLDGIFVSDFGLIKLPGFDDLPEEDRKQIIKEYAEHLAQMSGDADKAIEEDKTTAQISKLSNFFKEYTLGNVEIATLTDEEKAQIKANQEARLKNKNA